MSDTLTIKIGAEIADLLKALQKTQASVQETMERVSAQLSRGSAAFGDMRAASGTAANAATGAAEKMQGLASRLAALRSAATSASGPLARVTIAAAGIRAAFGAAAGALSEPLREFSRFDDAATRLAPFVGGIEAARDMTAELRQEAAGSTVDYTALTATAAKLASVFSSNEEVLNWTSAFHKISVGLGRDVNELVENFTRAMASGRFEAGFMDMFAQKGVNIWDSIMAAHPEKSANELRAMAAAGTLAFEEVAAAIMATTQAGGVFAASVEGMKDTAGGAARALRDSWRLLMADIGGAVAEHLLPAGDAAVAALNALRGPLAAISGLVGGLASALGGMPARTLALTAFALKVAPAIDAALRRNAASWTSMGAAATAAGRKVAAAGKAAAAAVATAAKTVRANLTGVIVILGELAAAGALAFFEAQTRAADRYDAALRRLTASFSALEKAKTEADFSRARKNVEAMIDMLDKHGAGWKEDAGMDPASGLNIETARATLAALEKRKKAEFSVAPRVPTQENLDAAEEFRGIEARRERAAQKAALLAAPAAERPALLLKKAGFDSAESFQIELDRLRADLNWTTHLGEATSEQVSYYRELSELDEELTRLRDEADKSAADARETLEAANAAYEQQRALLNAQLSGNRELTAELERQNKERALAADFEKAGVAAEEARRRAREIISAEAAITSAKEKQDKLAPLGTGTLATAQANVGGGRSLTIGLGGAVSVAREQLAAAREQLATLRRIAENTARADTAAAAAVLM